MDDRASILEEVLRYNERPKLKEDEFILEQYRERWAEDTGERLPENTARGQVKRMVQEGLLEERWVFHDGHRKRAYQLIKEEDQ